jgi:threonine synthase
MGLELAEQLEWTQPDCCSIRPGGGTGPGRHPKGYDELAAMGWISGRGRATSPCRRGCAPVVTRSTTGPRPRRHAKSARVAAGLRVPSPFAGRQMLKILRDSDGDAVAVSERAITEAQRLLARLEGIWTSPEGARLVAALGSLKDRGASPRRRAW